MTAPENPCFTAPETLQNRNSDPIFLGSRRNLFPAQTPQHKIKNSKTYALSDLKIGYNGRRFDKAPA